MMWWVIVVTLFGVGLFAIDRGIYIEFHTPQIVTGRTMRFLGIVYIAVSIIMTFLKIHEFVWKPW